MEEKRKQKNIITPVVYIGCKDPNGRVIKIDKYRRLLLKGCLDTNLKTRDGHGVTPVKPILWRLAMDKNPSWEPIVNGDIFIVKDM